MPRPDNNTHHHDYSIHNPQSMDRRKIILSKPLLRKWYGHIYRDFACLLPGLPAGDVVELGSGGGFIKWVAPAVITCSDRASDVADGLADKLLDGCNMDLPEKSVAGFFMLDVFHHLPDPYAFLAQAQRTLVPGGIIYLVDPANTLWARLIYSLFHREPFDPKMNRPTHGNIPPILANQALSSIVFQRERRAFQDDFPDLEIRSVRPHTFLTYLASGGIGYKSPVPEFMHGIFRGIERCCAPLYKYLGMFQTVLLEKKR